MPFSSSNKMGKSPVAYLVEGLFPNLARYLSGGSRYSVKQCAQNTISKDSTTSHRVPVQEGVSTELTFGILVQTKSFLAEGDFDTTAHLSRVRTPTELGFDSRKLLDRRSPPTFSHSHNRDFSGTSNDTLVPSPDDPSSPLSPVSSNFNRALQDAAEEVLGGKRADKIQEQDEVISRLRLDLENQTKRTEGLEADLAICERDREANFITALRLYRNTGNLCLVERRNLIDYVNQLRLEAWGRDSEIEYQNQVIAALSSDLRLYADQAHWVLMQQRFRELEQHYRQMPQELRNLERAYADLEDEYIDVFGTLKKLEGDHNQLKLQLDQILEERDEAEETARARESFLTELAARMYKRTIFMAGRLNAVGINPVDEELMAVGQLAYEQLGLSAEGIHNAFEAEKMRANEHRVAEEGREESCGPETHAGDASFPASHETSSNYPAPAPELELSHAPSVLGVALAQDVPLTTALAEEIVPQKVSLDNHTIEEDTRKGVLVPRSTNKEKKKNEAKGKKAREATREQEEPKMEEPKVKGPNRQQRRAASRGRKAAEKKAYAASKKDHAAAETAAARQRKAVAIAMM